MSNNEHIRDYLDYYLGLNDPPKYAVMLNGRWGIGKTYFLDKYIKERNHIDFKVVRVSFYGISKPEGLDDAVFKAAYSLFDNQAVKIAGGVLRSAGKVFKIETDLKAKDFLNKVAAADLYVFDDIERCDLPINNILGYINQFVEHAERKVIIVANEDEVRRKDQAETYDIIREKVIGKTLSLQPIAEQAFSYFIERITNVDCKKTAIEHKSYLLSLYKQSESNNLRILQQAIWDFERVFGALEERHRSHNAAMRSILGLFFSLSFDVKAGLLKKDDITSRDQSLYFTSKEKDDSRPITLTRRRYAEADIMSKVLSNNTLIDVLIDGYVDANAIKEDLDASSFFIKVEDEPAWKTVWSGFERTEEDFDKSLKVFEEQFMSRQFSLLGEIHHVFGLKLWLSKIGAIEQTTKIVVEHCMRYIDDLYASGRIPIDQGFNPGMVGGYAGLGVYEADTEEFKKLLSYLNESIKKAQNDDYPRIAQSVLELMSEQPDSVFSTIAYVNGGPNKYCVVPFWPAVPASSFVSRLIALPAMAQKTVFVALQGRYDDGFLDRELAPEKPWLQEVRTLILKMTEHMPPIARARMRAYVRFSIDKVLNMQEPPPITHE